MTGSGFTVEMLGDRALLVRFHAEPSSQLTALLTALARAATRIEGVLDACPGLTSVLIETPHLDRVEAAVPGMMADVEPAEGTLHRVGLTYDGEDLEWVCNYLGTDPQTLITRHSAATYDVRLLGSPGFVYLSDVAEDLAVPRMDEPRRSVAAGSVAIGGRQTGIYGRPRPGGWRIIGKAAELPTMVPGDRVRFAPR